MSTTILLFQAAIALSIFASGYRYRTATAAAWLLFTMGMVFVYWLALIQVGTIAVAWHYAGMPFGAAHYRGLLGRANGLRMDRFGYLELSCVQCTGCRCGSAKIQLAGSWPLLRASPTGERLLAERAELAVELEKEARKLETRRPGHRLVQRMQAEAKILRVQPDPDHDRKESEKYLWINERSRNLQKKFVRRLTVVDILPAITLLSVPVFLVTLFICSAGYYDEKDVRALIVIASITVASYLLHFLVGLYWYLGKRFFMPHLFIPGGGLLSLTQPA
jgi:hypothetical protein